MRANRQDPNYPTEHAKWLREKIPAPLLAVSIVGLPIILYGAIGGLLFKRYDVSALSTVIGGGSWLFLYVFNKGPKVAWDNDRVYERMSGWTLNGRFPWLKNRPWRSLRFDEIASLDPLTINDPGAKSALLPFQLLRLTARNADEEDANRHIWLYSLSIRDEELAPLLRRLDERCPGMMPETVLKRLSKWNYGDRELR